MILKISIVAICVMLISACSPESNPLEKSIKYPLAYSDSKSSVNVRHVVLVYVSNGNRETYDHICKIVENHYPKTIFAAGKEMPVETAPPIEMLSMKYKSNPQRRFVVSSKSGYSSIDVIEYESYVVVFLADARF